MLWFYFIFLYTTLPSCIEIVLSLGWTLCPANKDTSNFKDLIWEREWWKRKKGKAEVERSPTYMLLECCFVILHLFICVLFLFARLPGAAILSSAEKLTLCLAAPPINTKNAKTKWIPWFKQLYELKEIYCSRWLHNQNSWRFLCSIIGKEHPVLFPHIWKASNSGNLGLVWDILNSSDWVLSFELGREGPMRF